MLPEVRKLLVDIQQAVDDIAEFTRGMDLESYVRDSKCRAALARLGKDDGFERRAARADGRGWKRLSDAVPDALPQSDDHLPS